MNSLTLLIRGCKDTCLCGVWACVCTFMCWLLSEFLSFFFFLFFCRTHKGHDWMPCFCRAILQSHHSFLHVRFTLRTLLVTLPHPHQRLPRWNISRDLQPSSLRFRNMLIWSNLPPPLPFCVLCVKLANTLMTHLQNFYTCKDKPLQLSQPLGH